MTNLPAPGNVAMLRLAFYAAVSALIGAAALLLAAGGLIEGAIAGAVFGASLGVIIAVRKGAGAASPSFEYEAAGIHDGNLTTIARRNLVREELRDSFTPGPDPAVTEGADGESAKRERRT